MAAQGPLEPAGIVVDGTNALISLARGDYTGAAMNGAAMIPFIGSVANAGKLATKGAELTGSVARGGDSAADAARGADNAGDVARGVDATPPSQSYSQIDRKVFKPEREAYWKTEAKNNGGNYSAEDLQRMRGGKPPKGSDGHPMELHHVEGTHSGGLQPMTRTEHRLGENYKKNHPWVK
jgi:hypothetical protein